MAITRRGRRAKAARQAFIDEYNWKGAYVVKSYNAEYDRRGFSEKRVPSVRTQDQMYQRALARSDRAYKAHLNKQTVKPGAVGQLSAAQRRQRQMAARSPRRGRVAGSVRSGQRVRGRR